MAEWRNPDKAPFFSSWFKTMFPIMEAAWSTVPKVDIAVAKWSWRTMLPCEDGGASPGMTSWPVFKNVSLAADFLSDAAYQQVKFASR